MAGITGTLTATVLAMLTSTTDGVNVRVGAIEAADPSLTTPRAAHDYGAERECGDE